MRRKKQLLYGNCAQARLETKHRRHLSCRRQESLTGQAVVEYVTIILIVIALFAVFLNQVRATLQTYHNGMITRIATQ